MRDTWIYNNIINTTGFISFMLCVFALSLVGLIVYMLIDHEKNDV